MSIYFDALRISVTIFLSVVSIIWTHVSGKPAIFKPCCKNFVSKVDVWKESEPPRKIQVLPDLMQSAPASIVTFGLDS